MFILTCVALEVATEREETLGTRLVSITKQLSPVVNKVVCGSNLRMKADKNYFLGQVLLTFCTTLL